MTDAADQLRRQADALQQQAAQLRRLAEELDGAMPSRPATFWIKAGEAARITNTSPSTVRRWAEKYGCGYMTERGVWLFDKSAIMQIALGEARRDANNSFGDANGANAHIPKVCSV